MIARVSVDRMKRGQGGYTLLETVVALAIVGLLLTIGVHSIRVALAREEVDGLVRSIVHDLTAAQQAAITRRTWVTATFQDQTYSVVVSGGGTLRQQTVPSHVTFGPAPQSVVFDRRGTPNAGLSLSVSSSTAGRLYTIAVEAGTGRVTFSEP